jgi:hypothetical protein
MNSQAFEPTGQLEFLTELVNSHGVVAGDILQVGTATWAIHGLVPMDGHVLLAEYDSLESAQAALAQLPPNWPAGRDPRTERDAVVRPLATRAAPDVASVITSADPPVGVAPAYFLGRPSAAWRAALQPRLRPVAA